MVVKGSGIEGDSMKCPMGRGWGRGGYVGWTVWKRGEMGFGGGADSNSTHNALNAGKIR